MDNASGECLEFETRGVKWLTESANIESIPNCFILPEHERPDDDLLSSNLQLNSAHPQIPIIDMAHFHIGDQRSRIINQLLQASREWGFFQVINHGVDERILHNMLNAGRRFHQQPTEEKLKYYTDDYEKTRYAPSLDKPKDKPANWVDMLIMPISQLCRNNSLEDLPPVCREPAMEYWKAIRNLAETLLGALSEGLGKPTDHLQRCGLIDRQLVAVNYYPPCPQPNLTLGFSPHSDPGTITILLPDDVCGLQVLKDAVWVTVHPLPNAFIINIADQMEIVSNGKFKSVEHRAVTNRVEARLSIPSFFSPPWDVKVSPIINNVDDSEGYQECLFGDYMRSFLAKGLERKSALHLARKIT